MRIDLVDFRSTSPAGSTSPSLLSEWRVGALLQAIAVRDAASARAAASCARSTSDTPARASAVAARRSI